MVADLLDWTDLPVANLLVADLLDWTDLLVADFVHEWLGDVVDFLFEELTVSFCARLPFLCADYRHMYLVKS